MAPGTLADFALQDQTKGFYFASSRTLSSFQCLFLPPFTDFSCFRSSANVIGLRLGRAFQLEEMRDSLNYLQLRHSKLQYQARLLVEGGGVYSKLASGIPLEIEERVDEHSEEQLQAAIEDFLRRPMQEHLLRIKVLFAADSCDIVIGTSTAAADTAATGMLVNELLQRYVSLMDDPANAATEAEIAPMIDDLTNIFPSSMRTSFASWRGIIASFREFGRYTKSLSSQSPLRLSTTEGPASFVTLELSQELSRTIENNAVKAQVDLLSAFAAATSIGAKRKLFNLAANPQPLIKEEEVEGAQVDTNLTRAPSAPIGESSNINVDFFINHDMRIDCFQPAFPNDTMTIAETPAYQQVNSGGVDSDRDVWAVAKDIYNNSAEVISKDRLFDSYHFAITAASVKARQLNSVPQPPFTFQDARNLAIESSTIEKLRIQDIRYAETAARANCKFVLSRFQHKLQLSYNFPSSSMSAQEAETLADVAIELLRESPAL